MKDYDLEKIETGLSLATHKRTKEKKFHAYFRYPKSTKRFNAFLETNLKLTRDGRATTATIKVARLEIDTIKRVYSNHAIVDKTVYRKSMNLLVKEFIDKKNNSTKAQLYTYKKYVAPTIGLKQPQSVTIADIENILQSLQDAQLAQSTCNHMRSIIKPILQKATGIDFFIDITWKSKAPLTNDITDYMGIRSYEEVAKEMYSEIMKIENEDIKLILILSINLGRRISEIRGFKLEYINFEDGYIRIPHVITKTKQSKFQHIPLPSEALKLLNKNKPIGNKTKTIAKLVAVQPYIDTYKKLLAKVLKVEVEELRGIGTHISRKLIASILKAKGIDKETIQQVLTHNITSQSTYDRYAKTDYPTMKKIYEEYWTTLRQK